MKKLILFLSIICASGLTMVSIYNTVVDAKSWSSDIPASIQTARDYFEHAALGPNGRRSFSSHAFSPHRPRHLVKREWHRRYHASALADRALRSHRFGHRNKTLPADAGLKAMIAMLLLAVYLIIDGLLGFGINFGPAIFLLYLVALAAGIFILIGK